MHHGAWVSKPTFPMILATDLSLRYGVMKNYIQSKVILTSPKPTTTLNFDQFSVFLGSFKSRVLSTVDQLQDICDIH